MATTRRRAEQAVCGRGLSESGKGWANCVRRVDQEVYTTVEPLFWWCRPPGLHKSSAARPWRAPGVRCRRRGSALLTVLWISAALAAVGFALANTVRGETDRASTTVDEVRSYYLATG